MSAPREYVSQYLEREAAEPSSISSRVPFKRVAGDYHLRPVTGGTWVTREEGYYLPAPLKLLSPLLLRWVSRSIELQLGAVKEGAERLHRQSLLKDLDRDIRVRA